MYTSSRSSGGRSRSRFRDDLGIATIEVADSDPLFWWGFEVFSILTVAAHFIHGALILSLLATSWNVEVEGVDAACGMFGALIVSLLSSLQAGVESVGVCERLQEI